MEFRSKIEWWVNGLVAVIISGFVWATEMGWLGWDPAQFGAFTGFISYLIPFLVVSLLGAWVIRKYRTG